MWLEVKVCVRLKEVVVCVAGGGGMCEVGGGGGVRLEVGLRWEVVCVGRGCDGDSVSM